MTELQQYLAEEVAEDHVDGIITRRDHYYAIARASGPDEPKGGIGARR